MSKNNKKKFSWKELNFSNKRVRYGSFSAILVIAVVAVAIALNALVVTLEANNGWAIDMTPSNVFTFASQTVKTVAGLEQDVYIYSLLDSDASDMGSTWVRQLLRKYDAESDHIKFTEVDPYDNPTWSLKYDAEGTGLSTGTIIVTNSDESRIRIIDGNDLFPYSYTTYTFDSFAGEQLVTGAIIYVTQYDTDVAWLLQGHSEPMLNQLGHVEKLLNNEGMDVKEVNLISNDYQLEKSDILLVFNPTRDLSDDEYGIIRDFIARGGRLYITLAPGMDYEADMPNFNTLLKLVDIVPTNDLVMEGNSAMYYGYPYMLLPDIQKHEITTALRNDNMKVLLPPTVSLQLSDAPKNGRYLYSLLETSEASWSVAGYENNTNVATTKGEGDAAGPFAVAAGVEFYESDNTEEIAKMVVVGNSAFITESSYANMQGNQDFFANGINWLRDEENSISVRAKSVASYSVNIASNAQLWLICAIVVVVLPAVVLVAGLVVNIRRKHL